MKEIDSRYVTRTKWLIPSSRSFLRRIFTTAKAKLIATIIIKRFYSSKLFTSVVVFSNVGGRVRLLPSLFTKLYA
jgi:hypothetical protein